MGFFIYFMQIPAFYVFCRKSSNIFDKNLRTRGFIRKSLYKIFEQINEKFHAGINGYFCIKKILHFNGNGYFLLFFSSLLKQRGKKKRRMKLQNPFFSRIDFKFTLKTGFMLHFVFFVNLQWIVKLNILID